MLAISTSATDGIFPDVIKSDLGDNSGLASLEKPVLKVKSSVLTVNDHFIPINYIETATYQGQDIKDRVLFYGEVNTETAGEYHVVYYVPISIILSQMQINAARDFHSAVIDRIQSSYYSQTVIDSCVEKANDNGYVLDIRDVTVYQDRKDVLVNLQYDIVVPLVNIHFTEEILGYAR